MRVVGREDQGCSADGRGGERKTMGLRDNKERKTMTTYRGLWAWPIMRPRSFVVEDRGHPVGMAFQHVLGATTSWSGIRMDWVVGMGPVRALQAPRRCRAALLRRQREHVGGQGRKKGRTKRWRGCRLRCRPATRHRTARCAKGCSVAHVVAQRHLRTSPKGCGGARRRARSPALLSGISSTPRHPPPA